MIKKIILLFAVLLITGCTNLENQMKDTENAIFAVNKKNTGKVIALYPDKEKIKTYGTLVNGRLHGKYFEFYENGSQLLVLNYNNGKQNGPAEKYYPNGNIEIEGTMKNDLADGKFTFFYEDGTRQSVKNFKQGVYNGWYTEYYPNGNIKSKGNYTDGYKNGNFFFYNEEGKKIQEGKYLNGLRYGIWKNFNSS